MADFIMNNTMHLKQKSIGCKFYPMNAKKYFNYFFKEIFQFFKNLFSECFCRYFWKIILLIFFSIFSDKNIQIFFQLFLEIFFLICVGFFRLKILFAEFFHKYL